MPTEGRSAVARRPFQRARDLGWAAAALLMAGCADREEVIQSVMRVAEANYPGQLEVRDVRLIDQFRHRVTFGIKGDPITRFDLSLSPDPAKCRPGGECEARLRRAYAQGLRASARLKALNRAFRTCGVPLLAPDGMSEAFYVELDMAPGDPQPALDRLHGCVERYRQISGDEQSLQFRILRPRKERPAIMPQLVTFETKLPAARLKEPTYLATSAAGDDGISRQALGIDPQHLRSPPARGKLEAVVREQLKQQRPGATLPDYMVLEVTMLDPRRIDLVHALVPACSRPPPAGKESCVQDLAVRVAYDLGTGETSGGEVIAWPAQAENTLLHTARREPASR